MAIYGLNEQSTLDKVKHPSTSWANWKNWKFTYWDRDASEEKELTLPETMIVVAESWSVKGFLADKGWVWSNEIYSFADDVLTVRDNNWNIIKEWLWKDIKDYIKWLWLKLTKNVHYVDTKFPVELHTFCIKWAGLKKWMEIFSDDKRFEPANKLLSLDKVEEWKTWAVKYTYPVFKATTALWEEDRKIQKAMWKLLEEYKNATTVSAKQFAEEQAAKKEAEEDLPF